MLFIKCYYYRFTKEYNTQGKYAELIRVLDTTNMHVSIKKEYLIQVFMNNIPEGTSLFLLFTNKYNKPEDVQKVIEKYKIDSQFTEFELKLIDEYAMVSTGEAKELHIKLQQLNDYDDRIDYIDKIRLQNGNKELTEVEQKLLMNIYQLTEEEINAIQNNLILSSLKPTVGSIEHVLEQLKITRPKLYKI